MIAEFPNIKYQFLVSVNFNRYNYLERCWLRCISNLNVLNRFIGATPRYSLRDRDAPCWWRFSPSFQWIHWSQ